MVKILNFSKVYVADQHKRNIMTQIQDKTGKERVIPILPEELEEFENEVERFQAGEKVVVISDVFAGSGKIDAIQIRHLP